MSSTLEDFKKKYEIGMKTFEKIFELKTEELIPLVKKLVGDNSTYIRILDSTPTIKKTIINDVPDKININFYDNIIISPTGIRYKDEHSYNNHSIREFDEFFTLPKV